MEQCEREVIKIPTMEAFLALRDSLNLTDRQREIFVLKYSRGWRNIDIAMELEINQDTVGDELCRIRQKLVAVALDNQNKK